MRIHKRDSAKPRADHTLRKTGATSTSASAVSLSASSSAATSHG